MIGMASALRAGLIDDAYIFLRYAGNIAAGHGAVFNIGERVEGFTSPLWTLLLSVAALLPQRELVARWLGQACAIALVWVLLRAVRSTPEIGADQSKSSSHLSAPDLVVLGVGLGVTPSLALWAVSGMESALFTLLVGACLVSAVRDFQGTRISVTTVVLMVAATLTRPEAGLLAVYIAAFALVRRRSISAMWIYAAAMAVFLLARWLYYDAWLPNTYYAKMVFGWPRRLHDGYLYVGPAITANALILLLIGGVGLWAIIAKSAHRVAILFLTGWVCIWTTCVYCLGGDTFAMFRFLLPAIPALFLILAWSWSSIAPQLKPVARYTGLFVIAVALGVSHVQSYRAGRSLISEARLARSWASVGLWFKEHTPEDTRIATIVIGAVGYFSERPIIDMLGLTDRTIAREGDIYPKSHHGHARYHTSYVLERDPDIVLYHSSGIYKHAVHRDAGTIPLAWGYSLFDLVTDPRCARRFAYKTEVMSNGRVIEMQVRRRNVGERVVLKDM